MSNNDNNFMRGLGNAGAGAVIDVATQGLGSIFGNLNAKKSMKRQKDMANHMYDLEMRKWRETNLPAQVAMAKEAGLNPAMLYGTGGEGGQSQTAGGGQQGIMDVATQMNGMTTMADIELKKAQARNLDADTEVKTETGIDEAKSRTNLNKANTNLKEVENRIANDSFEASVGLVKEAWEEAKRNNDIGELTKDEQIQQIKEDLQLTLLEKRFKESQINLSYKQIKAIEAAINKTNQETKLLWEKTQTENKNRSWIDVEQGREEQYLSNLKSNLRLAEDRLSLDESKAMWQGVMDVVGVFVPWSNGSKADK